MLLGILTLITALSISAVAIYYSVAGLMTIFAAAALPIMIMGGALEIGKLVTAVWLHKYWKQATWWLKTYLTTAVVVLMFITSMGIFGFLSKAHIEQTAQSTDNLARVETVQSEIDRQLGIIGRAENRIRTLENSTSDNSAEVQAQIDKEQERIDNAYTRIQPAIEEQNQIIAGVTQLFQQELDRIDAELAKLQGYIDTGNIEKAQGMVGTKVDGDYGPNTARAFTEFQDAKRAERNEWLQKIQDAANSPTVVAARDEIARLRNKAEQQIADSNTLINRLRDQLGNSDNADGIQKAVDEQNERIRSASLEVESLTEEKIQLESEYRKLEAEVGPIKYIAEFIYRDTADNNMLEEAVRWVIITIIFVFDPLAVLLLIASQYTFEWRTRKDDDGGWLRQYEQARAQRIVDNPGFTVDTSKEEANENNRREDREEESQDAEELRDGQDQESVPPETGDDPAVVEEQERSINDVAAEKEGSGDNTESSDGDGLTPGTYTGDTQPVPMEQEDNLTQDEKSEIAKQYIQEDSVEKKDISSVTEEFTEPSRLTEAELDELDQDEEWQNAKQTWKEQNPGLTIKTFKDLYLKGKIGELPWEKYLESKIQSKTYIMKEDGQQVTRETEERIKPDLTEVIEPDGYIQNEEQTENSIWKRIKDSGK